MKLDAVLFDLDDTLHDKSATLKIVACKQFESAKLNDYLIDKSDWINLYIKFLISLLFAVDVSPIFEDEKDKFSVSIAMKIFYLEAIVTDKGKKRLNELREKFQKTEFLKTI